MNKPKGTNKHGLKRYIPADVKYKIRKDASFGCVFCGCVLVEYEHIEPEFHDALEHDPDKMTILCPMCHDKVTKKIRSKKQVWIAKENAKGLEQGYVNDMLFTNSDNLEFLLGNMCFKNMGVAISLYGKPLFWFEESINEEDPYTICCIFYGLDGSPIAYINRNEYIALVGEFDIVSVGTKLTITDKNNGCILDISREGGEPLQVNKLYTQQYDKKIVIRDAESPVTICEIGSAEENYSSFGSLSLVGQGIESKAIAFGDIPRRIIGDQLHVEIYSNLYGEKITNQSGKHIGWIVKGSLIRLDGKQVGSVRDGRAYSIFGEFISYFKKNRILYPRDQYENGEPIFLRKGSRKGLAVRAFPEYDLSHRFFGF